jgi:hypothetical protein
MNIDGMPDASTIEVINPSSPETHYVLNVQTFPGGRSVVTAKKPGRMGTRSIALRDLAVECPEWEDGLISFAGVLYEPVDFEAAERWMAAIAQHVNSASPASSSSDQFQRDAFLEEFGIAEQRWQYAVVNTGSFNSPERMAAVLGSAGRVGWELVTVYDKASNWFQGMEKGFMLLRRAVPAGVEPKAWSVQFRGQ